MTAPWTVTPSPPADELRELADALGVPAAAARLLVARGLGDPDLARDHLTVGRAQLHDPFLLPDLTRAADRLSRAVDAGERVVVHGDYDVDGITGAALLTAGLRRLGADAEAFVPDRHRDGYGVAARLVDHAGEKGVSVLVTVDTGSSAHEELARAAELGIDVLVCDHHLIDRAPAGAYALVNPQREDSEYPHRDLCGCAVAYKLLQGVHRRRGLDDPEEDLDLVALATVGDQVPLTVENRALVRLGLEHLVAGRRAGLRALLEQCRLWGQTLDAQDLAFQMAPRINAAGRIERPRTALDLLLSDDGPDARRLAGRLDDLNRQRRTLQRRVVEGARRKAAAAMLEGPPAALVLGDADWPLGVVGIGAAQITARFDVPTILLSIEGDRARGSARSVDGIDLKAALDQCSDLLSRYGGHAAAAGMELPAARIDDLARRFHEVVAPCPRPGRGAGLAIDTTLDLGEIEVELADFLQRLGPFGIANPEPRFAARGLTLASQPRRVGEEHLKLRLRQGGEERDFIGFSMAERLLPVLSRWPKMDVAFNVGYKEGSPFDPWTLRLHEVRPSEGASRVQEG